MDQRAGRSYGATEHILDCGYRQVAPTELNPSGLNHSADGPLLSLKPTWNLTQVSSTLMPLTC